jgi:hypothetical protein
MTGERGLEEILTDLFIYVPLGALVVLKEQWPNLADIGRRQADQRVAAARMIGQFAVKTGKQELEKRLAARSNPGSSPSTATSAGSAPAASEPIIVADGTSNAAAETAPRPAEAVEPASEPVPAADELAIPGYDSLAASQVVERLASLTPDELALIRRYETAGRHRRTILNRIERLVG